MKPLWRHPVQPPRGQRGAALLVALIIVTLIATLAASMIWQQWRAVQVETAERARAQSAWILNGALDWARLILREDARAGGSDHLGEPWAVPLAEARLSTFLAADRDHTADNEGPEAFLSGRITDSQSRYNLRNLVDQNKVSLVEQRTLEKLCESVGVSPGIAGVIANGLQRAILQGAPPPPDSADSESGAASAPPVVRDAAVDAPLMPHSVAQLVWLGVDPASVRRLEPYVTLLPVRTPLNLNTASREVIAAVVNGMDLGSAERLVQVRQRTPFQGMDDVRALLPPNTNLDSGRTAIGSSYFEVIGRLRLERSVLEERSMVERKGLDVVPWRRERLTMQDDTR